MVMLTGTHDWIESSEALLRKGLWGSIEHTQHAVFERILEAFTSNRVGEEHFYSVSGYGHQDLGREVTDKVFAYALQAEAACVRPHLVSGTHAIAVALNACLQNGDTLVSLTGAPYDTLEEVIGIRGDDARSLLAQSVSYKQLSCFSTNGDFLLSWSPEDAETIAHAQVAFIQRSRGYSLRPSLSVQNIKQLIDSARAINPTLTVMVDNCYGEFTEIDEPTAIGADLMAGSLIKNPGGGIAPTGGYVAGRKNLVERCGSVLTCPGVGLHGGYTFELTRTILQGLFLAPGVVAEALKGMSLAAHVFSEQGLAVYPNAQAYPRDVIQAITLGSPQAMEAFCKVVQQNSPIASNITPVPSGAPGYADSLIMAGGTFVDGSTIELSADGPLREPYTVYFQGGLTYAHTRLVVQRLLASSAMEQTD